MNRTKMALAIPALACLLSQAGDNSSPATSALATPQPASILILHQSKTWSIAELNSTAMQFLWAQKSMPKDAMPQVIVHVLPDDKNVMCEILYVQQFGQPFWRVRMGYDGKVQSFEKRLKGDKS